MPATFDALLFDFDGTLADTESIHHRAWNRALEPVGIHWDWAYYEKNCVGVADALLLKNYDVPDPAGFVARKKGIFQEELEQSQPFHIDTLALVRELRKLYRLAVVSSSFRHDVEPPLVRAEIHDCFQFLVCAEDVRTLKPSPEPYLLAAEKIGAKQPLVIEDSNFGVAAAKAAGFPVLRVSGPHMAAGEVREYLRLA